jgi:hypothetical protein
MSAVAPSEITEESIKLRLQGALKAMEAGLDIEPAGRLSNDEVVQVFYEATRMQEWVGIVEKTAKAQRLHDSQIAMRHQKGQIAKQIREGR